MRRAVRTRNVKLIVADPRRIDITNYATMHIQHRSGTDVALLNGLMHIIIKNGWQNGEFINDRTEGYSEFVQTVMSYPPKRVSEITGVPEKQLYEAAEIMGTTKPMAVMWAMGITQHIVGVRNVMSLANLQMLLGNVGIPGGGVNPLRGQNNVQGACDLGGLPNVYPGYQKVTDENARAKFENAWGVSLPNKVGIPVTELIPNICEGRTKALYIMAENPIMSDPDSNHVRKCLSQADFIVLQEIFPTGTSPYADVILPGTSFAEKDGTFTNTERRIQMVHKAIEPLGDSQEDWKIIAQLAKFMLKEPGKRPIKDSKFSGWDYVNTSEIMDEAAALAPLYAGVNHKRLEDGERLQWPVLGRDHPGTPILHVGKFTRGKGRFMPIEHIPPAELPDDDFPYLLNTGRVLYHWHGGEMTRRAKGLLSVYDEPLVEINPIDAEILGANNEDRIRITSRRGSIEAIAWITDRVPPGSIFANFHFPESPVNELTIAALDPKAKIPEYKVSAVKLDVIK